MKNRSRILPVSVLLCLIGFVFVLSAHAGLRERVYEESLANGLKIIILENHKAPVATFQVWYRVGSRNEHWGKTGLSHMLEHMMFKGTKTVGPEEYSRIIQENGGNDNAFTSDDDTAYFVTMSADRLKVAIDMEADRMRNLVLREGDFLTERMVVLEERRLRTEDNPQAYLQEQLAATAYQNHPYHWPVIGWMEDIERFTLDDLKSYYNIYYGPANAFVVAVGDFKKEEILKKLNDAFGPVPGGAKPNQNRGAEQPQYGERRVVVKREAMNPSILMGYHVPNLHSTDGYVLDVISALLSAGESSRFYRSLVREQRLVLDADSGYSLVSHDPGLFYLSADPLPGKDAAAVEKALDQEIEKLRQEQPIEEELEKVKNQLEAAFLYGQDSLFYQAMVLARYEMAGDWKTIDEYIPRIRKVTASDITRVARQYLVPDNRTVGILVPLPPSRGKPVMGGSPIKETGTR
jgi:zinc protease